MTRFRRWLTHVAQLTASGGNQLVLEKSILQSKAVNAASCVLGKGSAFGIAPALRGMAPFARSFSC